MEKEWSGVKMEKHGERNAAVYNTVFITSNFFTASGFIAFAERGVKVSGRGFSKNSSQWQHTHIQGMNHGVAKSVIVTPMKTGLLSPAVSTRLLTLSVSLLF